MDGGAPFHGPIRIRHPHWDLYSITEGEEGGALSLASFALCIPNFSSA